jgi:hypothetical protein
MAMAGFGVVGWGVFELEGRQSVLSIPVDDHYNVRPLIYDEVHPGKL